MSDETLVTKERLARCKYQAVKRILNSPNHVLTVFERVARMSGHNYKDACPRKRAIGLEINLDELVKRARMCEIGPVTDGCYGESDDMEVLVSGVMPMSDYELTGTIIHEALHYICKVDRGYYYRWMCTRDEHLAMEMYGNIV